MRKFDIKQFFTIIIQAILIALFAVIPILYPEKLKITVNGIYNIDFAIFMFCIFILAGLVLSYFIGLLLLYLFNR